jgi:Domain of unknown function (DUF4337)
MPEELHEMHEHAEHAHSDPSLAPATLTMAILAVLVAIASLLGHRSHTEEGLLHTKAADQWAYYQAKNNRLHADEMFSLAFPLIATKDAEAAAKLKEKYAAEAERYRDELKDIQTEAKKLEDEIQAATARANRFDLGEVFLEIGLVVTSITLLTRRKAFWYLGLVCAAIGMGATASGFFLH